MAYDTQITSNNYSLWHSWGVKYRKHNCGACDKFEWNSYYSPNIDVFMGFGGSDIVGS